MATTNLIARTFGSIQLDRGNGVPNHVAPTGALYTNIDSGITYINRSGGVSGTTWAEQHNTVWRGGAAFSGNTTAAGATSGAGWYLWGITGKFIASSGNATDGVTLDSSPNDFRLTITNAGKYLVCLNATVVYNGAIVNVRIGITKGDSAGTFAAPQNGAWTNRLITSSANSHPVEMFNVTQYINFAVGEKVAMAYNPGSTTGVVVSSASLYLMEG